MKKHSFFIFMVAVPFFMCIIFPVYAQETEKQVIQQQEFENKLRYMSSADQIFEYLGKPKENKYGNFDDYFHIKYKWDRIEDAPFKVEVIDRNRDHYYAKDVYITLFDRVKQREELSRLGRKSGSPLHTRNPDFKIIGISYSSYFPIEATPKNSQPVLQTGNTSIKVSVVSEKDFIADYKNRKLSELISSLGEPTEAKKSMSGMTYIWDYDDVNKIPIKIINSRQNNRDREHYCDTIKAIARGREGKISNLSCDDKKGWITEEEEKRIAIEKLENEKKEAIEVQKQKKEEEKRQVIAKTHDKPLSVNEVLSNINEKTHTSTQITEYRKSAYGKYVTGYGIVTEVKRDPIYVKFKSTGQYNYTLYVSLNDKKNSIKGQFHVKVTTKMDMSNVPLWQKIKFKGEFGRSTEGVTGEYVHLRNAEVELIK